MYSLQMHRHRRNKARHKKKLNAHRRKKKRFSRMDSRISSSRPSTASGVIENTGLSYKELFEILQNQNHPYRKRIFRRKDVSSAFSPIRYSSHSIYKHPPHPVEIDYQNFPALQNNFLEEEEENDSFEENENDQFIENRVRTPLQSQRISYLLPSSSSSRGGSRSGRNISGGNRRNNNSRNNMRVQRRGQRPLSSTTRSSTMSSSFVSTTSSTKDPKEIISELKKDSKVNQKRGGGKPFYRFFGSKGNFQKIHETSDNKIFFKNMEISDKVDELKNQDAFEKRLLQEVKTHLTREKIRSMFKSQQQNNLISQIKIMKNSPYSTGRKKRRRKRRRRRTDSDSKIVRKEDYVNEWLQDHQDDIDYSLNSSRSSVPIDEYDDRIDDVISGENLRVIPRNEEMMKKKDQSKSKKVVKKKFLAPPPKMMVSRKDLSEKTLNRMENKKKKYDKYFSEIMNEISSFERRKKDREKYREEVQDIKLSKSKVKFSKKVGKTKYYFSDPSSAYF